MTGCGFLHPRSVLLMREPLVNALFMEGSPRALSTGEAGCSVTWWGRYMRRVAVALAAVGLLASMRKPSLVGATNLGKGPATSTDAGGHGARDQEYGEHG
jgi:hypothetical protein